MELNEKKERVFTVQSRKGPYPQLVYIGENVPVNLTSLKGSRVIANFIPDCLLPEAIRLIRNEYAYPFKESALIDFLPRIVSWVNAVYRGSLKAWEKLKQQQDFVLANKDLFLMAVAVVRVNEKRKFPSWETDGFDDEALSILKGEDSFDPSPMINVLVNRIYAGKAKKVFNGKTKVFYPGLETITFLGKKFPNLVLAYRSIFEKLVSEKNHNSFPPLRKELEESLNQEVLSILRG